MGIPRVVAMSVLAELVALESRATELESLVGTAALTQAPLEVAPRQQPRLLSFYERNYFAIGFAKDTAAKFQLSLKYDLWPNRTRHRVYFAYTQLALWEIYARSAPFARQDFNPGLVYFYTHRAGDSARSGMIVCDFQQQRFGVDHRSNGESGEASRSLNRLFSSSIAGCYAPNGAKLEGRIDLWPPFFFDQENPNIEDYVGYAELRLSIASADAADYGVFGLQLRIRKGASNELSRGCLVAEATWQPPRAWHLTPYLFAQWFSGYAETLQTYDRATSGLRAGFGVSDGTAGWH